MPSKAEIALVVTMELLRKSGVRGYEDPSQLESIASAANALADLLYQDGDSMALPDVIRSQSGTAKTFKSSGGDAAITMTSVANNAARQSDKMDFGATRGRWYDVFADVELAATPTAGNEIECYLNPSSSATAGTDNLGGCGGSDAAYAGYSSNLDASIKQLIYIGSLVTTAQATATVQKGFVGRVYIPQRYASLVVYNKSGAAFHSSATNIQFRFVPSEDAVEDS